jgi:hypothetical protein
MFNKIIEKNIVIWEKMEQEHQKEKMKQKIIRKKSSKKNFISKNDNNNNDNKIDSDHDSSDLEDMTDDQKNFYQTRKVKSVVLHKSTDSYIYRYAV